MPLPKRNLLIDEPPLIVLPSLACRLGLNEAILVQQVHFNIQNERIGVLKNGRRWYRNTLAEWKEVFPFWSISTTRRAIANAEQSKVLLVKHFDGYDRDGYYSIDYEALSTLVDNNPECIPIPEGLTNHPVDMPFAQNEQMEVSNLDKSKCSKWTNGSAQNGQMLNRYSKTPQDSGARATPPAPRGVKLTQSGLVKKETEAPKPWWEREDVALVKRITGRQVPEAMAAACAVAWAACDAREVLDKEAEFAAYYQECVNRGHPNAWWWLTEWLPQGWIPERGARRRVVELPAPETFATLVVRGESFTAAPRKKGLLSQYKKQNAGAPTV